MVKNTKELNYTAPRLSPGLRKSKIMGFGVIFVHGNKNHNKI